MNTGQMLLTIGAAILLSITILTMNSRTMTASQTMDETKLEVMATSLASSKIDEVRSKNFDHNLSPSAITDLTITNKLGPDGSETILDYDDCDDFHNSDQTVKIIVNPNETPKREAEFTIKTTVSYAEISGNKIKTTNSRTWHKLISVEVSHSYLKTPIKMSAINSYYSL